MSFSKKSTKQRRRGGRGSKDSGRTLRPKLGDFKRRRSGEEKSKELTTNAQNIGNMRRGGLGEEAMLRTRHMDNIFDNFRSSIENIMDPLSSWGYFPSSGRSRMNEELGARTPLYDMVDDGERYKLIVELPGIDKDNIHIKAMDDSIEISAEQSQRANEQKKSFVYNQRSYSSFYCRIPVPEEILSSEATAKADSKGILRLELPKKTKSQDIKSRSITVE